MKKFLRKLRYLIPPHQTTLTVIKQRSGLRSNLDGESLGKFFRDEKRFFRSSYKSYIPPLYHVDIREEWLYLSNVHDYIRYSLILSYVPNIVFCHGIQINNHYERNTPIYHVCQFDGAITVYYLDRDLGLELSLFYFSLFAGTQFTKQTVKKSSSNE